MRAPSEGRVLLERILEGLDVTWSGPGSWDESEVYAAVRVEVSALPPARSVESALAALGLEVHIEQELVSGAVLVGRRGSGRLRCSLLARAQVGPHRVRGDELRLEWESGERPPLVGDSYVWRGRAWPVLFERACLYAATGDCLIIEGRTPQDAVSCVARARAWARASGFVDHHEPEPDLDADVTVTDRAFVATLRVRGPFTTFSVVARDPDGA